MQYAITIPEPCHEAWDKMTPDTNGRHCAQCCKTVVDFTNWETADILQYLQAQGGSKTCGRFKTEQVRQPAEEEVFIRSVAVARAPYYSKIAAILLMALGLIQMSCNDHEPPTTEQPKILGAMTLGEPVPANDTFTEKTNNKDQKTKVIDKTKKVKKEPKTAVTGIEAPQEERYIQGGAMPELTPYVADTVVYKTDTAKK